MSGSTLEQQATIGVLQDIASYLGAGSVAFHHEVNGGFDYMLEKGFNYDGYNVIAGANNFDGDTNLEAKESFGDKIIAVLPAL